MKTLLASLFLLWVNSLSAQKNGKASLYIFDENMNPCKIEQAKYLGCFQQLSDTAFQWKYYRFDGPLISVETYKDKGSKIPHGEFIFFGADGKIDSAGYVYEGKKNDWWSYMTDSSTLFRKEYYQKGRLTKSMDTAAIRIEREEKQREWDIRPGENMEEAAFKGGDADWVKFIQKNITMPDRARRLNKQGTVVAQFIIDTVGNVTDVGIIQSVEYSMDEEAIRVIKKSPKWKPAVLDGKNVKAYRKQPLTFRLPG